MNSLPRIESMSSVALPTSSCAPARRNDEPFRKSIVYPTLLLSVRTTWRKQLAGRESIRLPLGGFY